MSDDLRAEEVLERFASAEVPLDQCWRVSNAGDPPGEAERRIVAALLAHGSEHGVVILADGTLRALEDAETGWHTAEGFWSSGSADRPPPACPGDSEWHRHWRLVAPGEHPETQASQSEREAYDLWRSITKHGNAPTVITLLDLVDRLSARVGVLTDTVEAAREALEKYGDHDSVCPQSAAQWVMGQKSDPCDCGLTAALDALAVPRDEEATDGE